MLVSPSLTQLDLSGTSESPNPCLKEGELEPSHSVQTLTRGPQGATTSPTQGDFGEEEIDF